MILQPSKVNVPSQGRDPAVDWLGRTGPGLPAIDKRSPGIEAMQKLATQFQHLGKDNAGLTLQAALS